jgi:carbamoyl-phosphate synthase large subunit
VVDEIKQATYALAKSDCNVRGLMNIQFAVKQVERRSIKVYVLEVNPRASRTSPFVSKATNVSLAKIAAKVMAGVSCRAGSDRRSLAEARLGEGERLPVQPLPGVDIILGPEMRSTGEVMGIDDEFPIAFAKSQIGAGNKLPDKGTVFISLAGRHKLTLIPSVRRLKELGFKIVCTSGTARVFREHGIDVDVVRKLQEGRPNLLDLMANKEIQLILNSPSGKGARTDEG